jgi:hypothetical protein
MGKVVSLVWAGSLEQWHGGLGRATAAGWHGEGAATRAVPWLGDDRRGLGAVGCGWEPGRSASCRARRVPWCRCDGCVGETMADQGLLDRRDGERDVGRKDSPAHTIRRTGEEGRGRPGRLSRAPTVASERQGGERWREERGDELTSAKHNEALRSECGDPHGDGGGAPGGAWLRRRRWRSGQRRTGRGAQVFGRFWGVVGGCSTGISHGRFGKKHSSSWRPGAWAPLGGGGGRRSTREARGRVHAGRAGAGPLGRPGARGRRGGAGAELGRAGAGRGAKARRARWLGPSSRRPKKGEMALGRAGGKKRGRRGG